jgi:hypothetical protein
MAVALSGSEDSRGRHVLGRPTPRYAVRRNPSEGALGGLGACVL